MVEMVERLDLALLEGDQVHLCACVLDRLERLLELYLLDAVGEQEGNFLSIQLTGHCCSFRAAP